MRSSNKQIGFASAVLPDRKSLRGCLSQTCLAAASIALWLAGCDAPRSPAPEPEKTERVASSLSAPLPDHVQHPTIADSEIKTKPIRIACLSPVATEICCALGARDWLVGRSDYCVHPSEIKTIPPLGTLFSLKLEALLETKPDIVFLSGSSRAQAEQLVSLKLKVESLPDRSLQDVYIAIRRAGELLGRSKTADKLCAAIESDIQTVVSAHKKIADTRVLIAIEPLAIPPRPVSVAGGGSFLDDLLKRAGCTNAVRETSFFAPLSFEAIVAADPDVIIEFCGSPRAEITGEADPLRAWSSLGSLRAVKNRRVRSLVGPELFLPGPRVAIVLDHLCNIIEAENP